MSEQKTVRVQNSIVIDDRLRVGLVHNLVATSAECFSSVRIMSGRGQFYSTGFSRRFFAWMNGMPMHAPRTRGATLEL